MPLARWAVYQGGPQIWLAPTADDSDGWQATIRHIAIESGAFVVSVPQYIQRAAFGDDFPGRSRRARSSAGVERPSSPPASGELIAGPLYDAEGIVVADCDLRQTLHAKRWLTRPATTAAPTSCGRSRTNDLSDHPHAGGPGQLVRSPGKFMVPRGTTALRGERHRRRGSLLWRQMGGSSVNVDPK